MTQLRERRMNNNKNLNIITIIIGLVFSLLVVVFTPTIEWNGSSVNAQVQLEEESIISQDINGILTQPQEVVKIYNEGDLIGVISDYAKVDNLLKSVYAENYQESFPNTSIGLDEDVYISRELSSYQYENIDDQILDYLLTEQNFTVEANQVDFSNEFGVYATIYVENVDDFYEARDQYLLNFVSEEAISLIGTNQELPELQTYGSRELNVEIRETITITRGLANPDEILSSQDEIFMFLAYGEDTSPTLYTVVEFDTVAGVGKKSENFLSAEQIVAINPGILTSTEQVLEVGSQLNVRYFDSPITVEVTREQITKEIVYPGETLYYEDASVRQGMSYVAQEEENGSQNVLYEETWINGVLVEAVELSSIVTKQPINRIEYYGSLYVPGVGTGSFRWPVDNAYVSCGWLCYNGHLAADIQNQYDRYGSIYAADRGTVIENSYDPIGGYHIVIDHNNGYVTYYGHMAGPGFIPVGSNVEKGEVIGDIGITGVTTGPHVHFSIEYNGARYNPINYLP